VGFVVCVAEGEGVGDDVEEGKDLNGWFRREKNYSRVGAALWVDRFRVRFSPFFFSFKIAAPLKMQCSMVFIGNVLLGFQTSPSTFFLFCKFDFS